MNVFHTLKRRIGDKISIEDILPDIKRMRREPHEYVSYKHPDWTLEREARIFTIQMAQEVQDFYTPPIITREMVTTEFEKPELTELFGKERFEIYLKGHVRYDDDELFEMDNIPWKSSDRYAECTCLTYEDADGYVPCRVCFEGKNPPVESDSDDSDSEDGSVECDWCGTGEVTNPCNCCASCDLILKSDV